MKAIWLTLIGVTACTVSIDEGPDSHDTNLDGGASTSFSSTFSSSDRTSTTGGGLGSGQVAPTDVSSSNTAAQTSGSGGDTTTGAQPTTSFPSSEAIDASVESGGTIAQSSSSQDSTNSQASSSDPTQQPPADDPEPGKLAGITERHNYYRRMVNTDESLPELVWDPEIAVLAQEWAEVLAGDCSFEHSGRRGLGENLATFGASSERGLDNTGVDAVDMWHSEVDCYTYGTIAGSSNMGTEECSAECDEYGGCGHYTQLVWRETLRVGCGVASCFRDGFYWDTYVCNYDPPGNYIGEYPY